MCIDRGAQILDEQVRVRSGRDAHVAVAHVPLHTVHALAQQLRCEGVAQVVEAHLERQRLRPKQPATDVLRPLTGAVRALKASRAVTLLAVVVPFLVTAPAAAVLPALRDAGATVHSGESSAGRPRAAGDALLKIGMSFQNQNDCKNAVLFFEEVEQAYKSSQAAKLARDQIAQSKGPKRKPAGKQGR